MNSCVERFCGIDRLQLWSSLDCCKIYFDIAACSPVFKKLFRPREVSQMATPNPFITTEQLCRLRCLFDPDCVSYQINRNPEAPFCLVQTDVRNLMQEKLIKADLVTDYILVNPCTNRPFDKSAPGRLRTYKKWLYNFSILKLSTVY